jgi:hypothetical protein
MRSEEGPGWGTSLHPLRKVFGQSAGLVLKCSSRMDQMDDIRYRMRVANLEARRELHEIERAALTREIDSPLTSALGRKTAIERRDAVLSKWAEIVQELQNLRESK